jgi:hypothetical protein
MSFNPELAWMDEKEKYTSQQSNENDYTGRMIAHEGQHVRPQKIVEDKKDGKLTRKISPKYLNKMREAEEALKDEPSLDKSKKKSCRGVFCGLLSGGKRRTKKRHKKRRKKIRTKSRRKPKRKNKSRRTKRRRRKR